MAFEIRDDRYDTLVLTVEEDISAYRTNRFKKVLRELARRDDLSEKIIIDLGPVKHVDPLALGVLVSAARDIREREGDIKFANMCPAVRDLFDQTRLSVTYEIYDSLEKAVKSYKDRI